MRKEGDGYGSKSDRQGNTGDVRLLSLVAFVVFLSILLLLPSESLSQLAKGKGRFIGNALSGYIPIYSGFSTYWNQVTPGNAGKWGSVEGVMNSFDWTWQSSGVYICRMVAGPYVQTLKMVLTK